MEHCRDALHHSVLNQIRLKLYGALPFTPNMDVRNRLIRVLVSVPLAAVVPATAIAQSRPDAGALQQQIERDVRPMLPERGAPRRAPEPAPMTEPAGVKVTVREFRFAGNTLLSNERLAAAVAPFMGRPLEFAELQAAVLAVASVYRDAGWVVRAYLPAQDIDDGVVTIRVVEAVFGRLEVEGDVPPRADLARLRAMIEAQQAPGKPLHADAVDRGLLLADDLPGVAVAGSLREGERERETDLVLRLSGEPLLAGEWSLDNTGSRATGKARASASLQLNSPLGLGELASANLMHTLGSDFIRIGATLPVGHDGWRVGASASQLAYRLVAPEFQALEASGTADTVGIEAAYPIIRSRLRNLYFTAGADRKAFDNQAGGAVTTRYRADVFNIGLSGNLFDNLGGGGANSASLVLTTGSINLDGSPNQDADAATARTAGAYRKLRYAISRQQVITESVSASLSFTGQWSPRNLDSSEKFYLGGAAGVRAYPSGEGGGAVGRMATAEARWRLPDGWGLAAFYDVGSVVINPENAYAGAPSMNRYGLKGAGLALAWEREGGPSLRLTWSRRIGANPNQAAFGNDQDGSLLRNRLWLSVGMRF